ncbi:hypothetical protein LWI28_009269 [Acer negundo]|uniref:RNase H type-1 domain-containing protein n=1 Tax=Acer negundo TaxID=4023 RepID=A0AAD5IL64_ACENE|nr:hypothetical protein LWI28_009269 [Acer negundo]
MDYFRHKATIKPQYAKSSFGKRSMAGSLRLLLLFAVVLMLLISVYFAVVLVKQLFIPCGPLKHREVLSHQPSWKPPEKGVFKINCDASFQLRSCMSSVGIVIRDYKGKAIAVRSSPVLGYSSVEMLEAQACLEGLQLAIDIGISGVIIESDDVGVIQLLYDHVVPRTELGSIIRTSLALGVSVNLLSFVAVMREADSVVHGLAQLTLSLDGPMVWLDELPSDIAGLVRVDSSSSGYSF